MTLHIEIKGGVFVLTMQRPDKKNAINAEMYSALTDALKHASEDQSVRCILIQGSGGDFTAGNDLDDFKNSPAADQNAPGFKFIRAIMAAEKPIVAAVSGLAVGVGVTMLSHCDLVYAGKGATFTLPFVSLGLCPEAGSTYLMPRLLGHQKAAEKLLLGEPFGANYAYEAGLVNEVVADNEVAQIALTQAMKLAELPASAVRLTKALMKQETQQAAADRFAQEGGHFINMLRSPEAAEAFNAFFGKRKPDFRRFS